MRAFQSAYVGRHDFPKFLPDFVLRRVKSLINKVKRHQVIEPTRTGADQKTGQERMAARRRIFAKFGGGQAPCFLGPGIDTVGRQIRKHPLGQRQRIEPPHVFEEFVEVIFRGAPRGPAQFRKGGFCFARCNEQERIELLTRRFWHSGRDSGEPQRGRASVHRSGEPAQRTQGGECKMVGDQCFDGAIDEIRQMRAGAQRIIGKREPLKIRALGEVFDDRGGDFTQVGEPSEDGEALQEAQEPQAGCRGFAALLNPAQLLGGRGEEPPFWRSQSWGIWDRPEGRHGP